MIEAFLLLGAYFSFGVWIALYSEETNPYTAFACGLIWLPCIVWYVAKHLCRRLS